MIEERWISKDYVKQLDFIIQKEVMNDYLKQLLE
jgi:hypothetical protein